VDVRDLWPQVVAGMGFMQETSVAYRFLRKMADATYRRADGLVGNSQGICEYLRETVPGRDVALVFNPVDMKLLSPLDEQERESIINAHSDIFINDGRPLFLFSGTFSNYIGLNDLFAAWVKLKARTGRWRFIMIGQGEGEVGMRKCISENGLEDQVKLLPFMDRSELVKYIGAADYCFASLRNSPMLRYAIPTKVIEYLACGKPVVAVVGGAFGEMLKEEGVAHVCEPGDVDGMVDMLLGIIESATAVNAERNPREFIRRYFSVEAFDKGFGSFFDGICQNS
jgi:glycosyltransferase involved in cell wall biosynthesis